MNLFYQNLRQLFSALSLCLASFFVPYHIFAFPQQAVNDVNDLQTNETSSNVKLDKNSQPSEELFILQQYITDVSQSQDSNFYKNPSNISKQIEETNRQQQGESLILPFPQNAEIVLCIHSLLELDDVLKTFFKQTSNTEFSPLSTIRLKYNKILSFINQEAPMGVIGFCNQTVPEYSLLLPIKSENYSSFISEFVKLSSETSSYYADEENEITRIKFNNSESIDVVLKQVTPQYVAIVSSDNVALLNSFEKLMFVEKDQNGSLGLSNAVITIQIMKQGIANILLDDSKLWKKLFQYLSTEQEKISDFSLTNILNELRNNLKTEFSQIRLDIALDKFGIYLAIQTMPVSGSSASERLLAYKSLSPLNFEADRFFGVLPETEAAVSGQTFLAPNLTQTLPKPFDQVKSIEYTLSLPRANELAAESWLFFLEVEDSEQFAYDMIVPKAKEIGKYIGSKQAEELGAQILGNMAERRRERQLNRRRQPRQLANPDEAAERGSALGNLIGGWIGSSAGKDIAMQPYNIEGFTTYISDLETYARQKALMRAEEEENVPPPVLIVDRNRPLLSSAGTLLANIENGEGIQRSLLQAANARADAIEQAPLVAKLSYLVILDEKHVLLSLGAQDLLHLAINNWKSLTNPNIHFLSEISQSGSDAITELQSINQYIPNKENDRFVGAVRFDLVKAQVYYQWLCHNYFATVPIDMPTLPHQLSPILILSSASDSAEITRIVTPIKTFSEIYKLCSDGKSPLQDLLNIISMSVNDSTSDESSKSESEIDFDFDEPEAEVQTK